MSRPSLAVAAFLSGLLLLPLSLAQQQSQPSQPHPPVQQPVPLVQQPPQQPQPRSQLARQETPIAPLKPCEPGKPLDCKISGPYTHENLSIFLLHGPNQFQLDKFLTLAEALEQKKFVIQETQSVNQLQMENLGDLPVVVLSGDIFKGGQQDRFARFDLIVPPKSGQLPLACYCVERTAARWMAKLDATNSNFERSPGQVTGNDFRVAGRYSVSQAVVWDKVTTVQRQLTTNAAVPAQAKESDSSLALSLQIKEIKEKSEKYAGAFKSVLDGKSDVVGFGYAINGQVLAADVYGNSALFQRAWPRMLQSISTEAFAELTKDKKFEATTVKALQTFLADADKGKAGQRETLAGQQERLNEAEKAVRFETLQDSAKGALPAVPGAFLRRNYLQVDRKALEQPAQPSQPNRDFRNQREIQPPQPSVPPPAPQLPPAPQQPAPRP